MLLRCLLQIGILQVHMCNKLANRHVRVGLANPSEVPRCDICENAPGMPFLFIWFLEIKNLHNLMF